jgi:putative phosphoribosyl transferase
VVVGLPRGGVPVAEEVALALDAPLDVLLVRKLGVPFQPELGMGAIGEDGVVVINEDIVRFAAVRPDELANVQAREREELDRRARRYRSGRERAQLAGRVVVIVDDGIATGSTAKAACEVARAAGAKRVVLAVPVAPEDWTDRLAGSADELICVDTPSFFFGVGQFYLRFNQTSDEEVVASLARVAQASRSPEGRREPLESVVEIQVDGAVTGALTVPTAPRGLVLFAHGSGSSRHSPRNRHVADVLNRVGLATLLFDLLTPTEEHDRANVFDIELLGHRLIEATEWVAGRRELRELPIGYFGASTGAAAALWAAAEPEAELAAVVSRGGRPDLAGPRLSEVRAPTLLIVGGHDDVVIRLNQQALERLRCPAELEIVPGATHLFEEPGTLDVAAGLAADWFTAHMIPGTG